MTVVTAIIVLGILIFVHELGHFLMAKRAGVGVLKFSLGFGPKLAGVRRGETEYLLSALPLGGYVKMVGEDPTDESPEATDPRRSFAKKSVGTRALIILAGPLSNIVLPVLIFWAVFSFVGQTYLEPVVGSPDAGSPAAVAGVERGDRIRQVNGVSVSRWDEVANVVQDGGGRPIRLTIARDGKTFDVQLDPRLEKSRDLFGQEVEAWEVGLHPLVPTRIGQVVIGHVAEQAGLQSGDRIVALNGTPVYEWEQLAKGIHAHPGRPVHLTVERGSSRLELDVTPRPTKQPGPNGDEEIGLIGIAPSPESHFRRLNPIAALGAGITKTFDMSVMIVQGLAKLVQGHISADTIGGPILIGQMAGQVAQRGALELLTFTAMLSINLAILNLLPVPVLDGGHLFFALIEWMRGKPVSLRKREIAQQVGVVLLVALMIFATYNDLFRLFGWAGRP